MEKTRKKLRLTIEMDIDIDPDEYPDLTVKEVEKSIIIQDSDVIDGFEITTYHPDLDNTSDFFLKNGVIVQKELISESQTEEIDYKHEVIDSVDKEFQAYESDLLDGKKTAEEVFCNSYQTAVKTEFRDTICGEAEFDDKVYKALYQEKGAILEGLYQDFLTQPEGCINSFGMTKQQVVDYCYRYFSDIMNEQDESPQMQMG